MSTLELEHLKHTSSSSNNLSVHSDGTLTLGNLTNLNVNGRLQVGDSSITQAYTQANLGYVMDVQASTGNQTYISIAEPGTSSLGDNGMIIGEDTTDSWIAQRGNKGMNFSTNDLGRLLIAPNGSVTHPYNACYESGTGNFSSQGSASLNNMDFGSGNTPRFNQGSKITYAHTNGGRFTVANAGMYEITLQTFVDLQSGDVRAYYVEMQRNGSSYTSWGHWSMKLVVNTTHGLSHMTSLASLAANDYLEFKYRLYDSPTATLRPRVIIKQVG